MNAARRISLTWFILSALTLMSWWIGANHHQDDFRLNAPVTFGVMAIAALKARTIIQEFMEARQAPKLLSRICDASLALLFISLLAIYILGMGVHT